MVVSRSRGPIGIVGPAELEVIDVLTGLGDRPTSKEVGRPRGAGQTLDRLGKSGLRKSKHTFIYTPTTMNQLTEAIKAQMKAIGTL